MKKNGFTLIELLAVIIILGVLMIIAIPSVTRYIDESRKSVYVSTAKSIVGGARNLIHSGELDLSDTKTTYYIDGKCISTDNGYKSPYGEFDKAYVVVTVTEDGNNHEYYWTSVDSSGMGVKSLININKLSETNIEDGIESTDITTNRGIDERSNIIVIDGEQCTKGNSTEAEIDINGATGKRNVLCQRATTLHSTTCERESNGCAAIVGSGNTITYGTIPGDTLKPGDAFDCDVNKDNVFDSDYERFYYITDDGTNAVLLHSKTMNNSAKYAYDTTCNNKHGPRTAYQALPNTSEWKNSAIILPGTRQITDENGLTSISGENIELFTYEGKAARLITAQELRTACGNDINYNGAMDSCSYTMESIPLFEVGSGTYGFWLETPRSSNKVYMVHTAIRSITTISASISNNTGVKAVITTKLSKLE